MSFFLGWCGVLVPLLDFLSTALDCCCIWRPVSFLVILYPSVQLSMCSHLPLPKSAFLKAMVFTLVLSLLSPLRILNSPMSWSDEAAVIFISLIGTSLLVKSRYAYLCIITIPGYPIQYLYQGGILSRNFPMCVPTCSITFPTDIKIFSCE